MFWLLALGGPLALLLALYLDGRRRERKVLRDWELVLGGRGERALQALQHHTDAEVALVEFTYTKAREARDVGHMSEALRLLDCGCRAIEEFCPSVLRSLAAMAVLSRMVAAMAPVTPLRPQNFKLRQLGQLAFLGQFLHYFLVTTAERFRLRVHILARGFATLLRVVGRATRRIHAAPRMEADWDQIDAARQDVRALTQDYIESFRILLLSIAAEKRSTS
jgi:hypothetical protein